MSPGTVALVLAAATAHAVWNIASKYKREDTFLFVWAYTCASALLCVPIGIVVIAKGQQVLDWRLMVGSAVSATLHIAYSLILQAGYDRAELGVVYSVARGTGPMLTMLFAVLLLGERLTTAAMLGAFLIVAGILFVVGNLFRSGSSRPLPGVFWGAATGATIAGYTLWDSYSVTSWQLAPVSYYAGTLLLQSLILTPIALLRRHRIPAVLRAGAMPIFIVAVFSPLAYILVLTAMLSAPVALVAPLRESSIVIGSFLAWWLFREGNLARRVAGGVIVLAGIVAISL
ncbi:DMT family transporter [Cupriavidus sp. UME77]|uniref:DMT family transporter n=1 Tax=Cupriavidus sp. UME77 TaxID=1862321 RepID=UPI001600B034|nr:DMT family transporter [Cupriavidus sp. UME77]MBB1629485.1 transporter [Cupriavidus sp. UME77]